MKTLIFAVMFAFPAAAFAAGGMVVYEVAATSITVASVSLSSTAATLISKSPITTMVLGEAPIQWYSITAYNVAASSGVYAFSASATVPPAPVLTCANGAPIGGGLPASPWHFTEQFVGMYMWGMSCATNATLNLKAVYRGR